MIETERLILRRWRESDSEPYINMMADPQVGEWLGGPFKRDEALARIARNEAALEAHGYGRLAMERKSDAEFLGYCGLMPIDQALPFDGGFEVGWSWLNRHGARASPLKRREPSSPMGLNASALQRSWPSQGW